MADETPTETLRRLSEAATPGPWAVPVANVFRVIAPDALHTNQPAGAAPPYPWCIVANVGHETTGPADAAFIAAAANHVRDELAEGTKSVSASGGLVPAPDVTEGPTDTQSPPRHDEHLRGSPDAGADAAQPTPTEADTLRGSGIEALIEASSLGTPEAKAAWDSVAPETARAIALASRYLTEASDHTGAARTCEHSWRFMGDDPYTECLNCGEIRDALTDILVRPGESAASSDPTAGEQR